MNENQKKRVMQSAVNQADSLDLDLAFYLEEWDHVVQSNDVDTRDAYLSSPGRSRYSTKSEREV